MEFSLKLIVCILFFTNKRKSNAGREWAKYCRRDLFEFINSDLYYQVYLDWQSLVPNVIISQ